MPEQYEISSKLKFFLRKSSSRALSVARATNTFQTTTNETATLLSFPIEMAKDGPIAQYRLGESGALTTAEDATGNERHGSYIGGVTNTAGSLYLNDDSAKSFDGIDGSATFPDITLSTNASIEGIFMWEGAGTNSLIRDATSGAAGWIFAYESAGNLAFRIAGTTFVTTVAVSTLKNIWTHYVLTKSGGTVRFYIDNTQVYTNTGAPSTASQSTWYCMRDGLDANYIQGRADEIAFYDSVLSTDRIAAHYNAFKGIQAEPG